MAQLQNLKINNTDIFDLFYPIGSIYETSNSEFNPNNTWGGTWERIKGKVIVGVDEDDSDFESSQLSGGNKSVTLTINEMPSHGHEIKNLNGTGENGLCSIGSATSGTDGPSWGFTDRPYDLTSNASGNFAAKAIGGSQAHTNLQPYYTAYIWERIS